MKISVKGPAAWHPHHPVPEHFSQDKKAPSLSCLEKHCEPTKLL